MSHAKTLELLAVQRHGSLSTCREKGSVVLRGAVGTWLHDSLEAFVIT